MQEGSASDYQGPARVCLSVGLTAHRDLAASEEPRLRRQARDFFLHLRAQFPELPLRLMSALAEGGDQLVAEEALALGIELVVPLPFAQDEYERDFHDDATIERFRGLLARARVRVLPLAAGNDAESIRSRGDARNRQYAQLGMFVSSHCQLLLALWDGTPSAPPAAPRKSSSTTCATQCQASTRRTPRPTCSRMTRATWSTTSIAPGGSCARSCRRWRAWQPMHPAG